jgi:two-component system, NarL family, response regulator LiaR
MSEKLTRIFIADDVKAVRDAIRRILEQEPDFRVVGESEDYAQTLESAAMLKPDVLISDLRMRAGPKAQPSDFAELARVCGCKVVAVTFATIDQGVQAVASDMGAAAILDKVTLAETLVPAIRKVTAPK